ncbi:MAG: helix-turn-helix transcriptional regulator [Bacteroidota bacterium]
MNEKVHIQSVAQLHAFLQLEPPRHPFISIIRIPSTETTVDLSYTSFLFDIFQISFYTDSKNLVKYGSKTYALPAGTIVCSRPGQVFSFVGEQNVDEAEQGWTLAFHPDLIGGTPLASNIDAYTFFSYTIQASLQLSQEELKPLESVLDNLERELTLPTDDYSRKLIVSNLELLLDYCLRFYSRQLDTRPQDPRDIVSNFEQCLTAYFQLQRQSATGLPSVKFFARKMNMSPNYLSELLKKETGRGVQEHIHYKVIELAKAKLLRSNIPVSQVAYELGFEYPQYFSKLFKTKTGWTPREFRKKSSS